MKPEEIDRLFRDELEKLDSVPEVEWSDAGAWNKVSAKIGGGWNNFWTGATTVFTAITIIVLYFLLVPDKKAEPVLPMEQAVIIVKDSVQKDSLPAMASGRKKEKLKERVIALPPGINRNVAGDTLTPSISMITDSVRITGNSSMLRKRNVETNNKDFKFSLPHASYLKMNVSDGFNLSNLSKSLKAQKDEDGTLYYFYEQNKSTIPPAYRNTSPRYLENSRPQTITNFNR